MAKTSFIGELAKTVSSLVSAAYDWLLLRTPLYKFIKRDQTFAFLVHPRTDEFRRTDVYGMNDIYRPFPALRHIFKILPEKAATRFMHWFARTIVPITLSRIRVRVGNATFRGYLLSTVRTPSLLIGRPDATKKHVVDIFKLGSRKGVSRVGLGALLPSMTGYGKRYTSILGDRPAVSTGHAYTAYTIAEFLTHLVSVRNSGSAVVRAAVVGAAGSTGKALLRVLKQTWKGPVALELLLVDVPQKEVMLKKLQKEAQECGRFALVRTAIELTALQEASYAIVVTNASGSIIKPEHVRPGTVIIDDSQPRNTGIELVEHGCFVVDVLARVPGLEVNFDFGFQTQDHTVTFTCLAETVLATVASDKDDLAVGEVTDEVVDRTLKIVSIGKELGLVGEMPFFSFGKEMTEAERKMVLRPSPVPIAPAAE